MTKTQSPIPTRWHVVPQGTIVSVASLPTAKAARIVAARQDRPCRVLTTAQLALSTTGTLPYAV